jgi:type III secretion protein Q
VEETMTMETGAPEGASPARGWEDLEVEIAFDLGEQVLSLREVRALQPGSILALPSNPEGKVRIRVNGKTVGSGALLKVDGQVGVRILSLPEDSPVPDPVPAGAP